MNRMLIMVPVLALAAGCTGTFTTPNGGVGATVTTGAEVVDDTPPVNVETYPRYEYNGGYVYNVNGRYYHRNGSRWMRYNERPRNLDERFERRENNNDNRPREEREHHDFDRR
jgi:hypothetical protein